MMEIRSVFVSLLLLGSLAAQTESHALQASTVQQPADASSSVKIDPAKEADIRRLMDLVGAKTIVAQVLAGMGKDIRPALTSALPAGDYRDKLIDLFLVKLQANLDGQKLLDLIVPVYDKYLSDEEIKALIQFYETPLGQKTISVMPMLIQESKEAGRKWGEERGRQSMIEVLTEHPEMAKAMQDAKKN